MSKYFDYKIEFDETIKTENKLEEEQLIVPDEKIEKLIRVTGKKNKNARTKEKSCKNN